ncbi:hypothetical protein [Nostoc sp. CCY0012]|uniref:hypothetical protein n=1 Tax=Nostoc sp. CCY0012 TaxID=1056123 RepID=UPI0039C710BF
MSNRHSSSISSDSTASQHSPSPRRSSRRRWRIVSFILLVLVAALVSVLALGRFSLAYLPPQTAVLNPETQKWL